MERVKYHASNFHILLWSHFELHKHEQYKAYDYVTGQTVPVTLTSHSTYVGQCA